MKRVIVLSSDIIMLDRFFGVFKNFILILLCN